ncbi:hypothetical protein PHISP_00542 [Aspergillus sp. HF37]|nr:hypothetical protein PHISP_00542 [Aspergillus sp. HF37]
MYLVIPVFLAIYLGHKLTVGRSEPWLFEPAMVNLVSGVEEVNADAEMWDRMERIRTKEKGEPSRVWKISLPWE